VYLAAYLLAGDETTVGVSTAADLADRGELPGAIRSHHDGTWTLDCDKARSAFYGDCDDDDVGAALLRLDAHPVAALVQAPAREAWRSKPSTYVVCALDRAVPPELQRRLATRATTVVEWPSGHSPFFSMPDQVAALLAERAGAPSPAAT
jgi:hypothetical protein